MQQRFQQLRVLLIQLLSAEAEPVERIKPEVLLEMLEQAV
jgi:hypothetical protein